MNADVMSTIENIQRQTSGDAILEILNKTVDRYGFGKLIISGQADISLDVPSLVLLSGWDDEWLERYIGMGYSHGDPVARHCLVTTLPFSFSDAPYDRETDRLGRMVMDDAHEFGMDVGLCIPVYLAGALQGVVSMVGDPAKLDEKSRLELHMLSLYAHSHLSHLKATGDLGSRRVITARESEVLKWVASGKTADQIAKITGMSARTVNQHCENAQRRLGTSNRLQTVVEAIRLKLISL